MENGFSKWFAVAILLCVCGIAAAQYQVKATSLTHDVKDLSQRNTKVLDQNGERCALLIFETPIPKLFKFDLEDAIIASNANIGGPTTAAGMAIAQGWTELVGPAMLTGTFGYVIGTYLGIIVGTLIGA